MRIYIHACVHLHTCIHTYVHCMHACSRGSTCIQHTDQYHTHTVQIWHAFETYTRTLHIINPEFEFLLLFLSGVSPHCQISPKESEKYSQTILTRCNTLQHTAILSGVSAYYQGVAQKGWQFSQKSSCCGCCQVWSLCLGLGLGLGLSVGLGLVWSLHVCVCVRERGNVCVCECVSASVCDCTKLHTLQHTATRNSTKPWRLGICKRPHCITLQLATTRCNTLQHTATRWKTPQLTATHTSQKNSAPRHLQATQLPQLDVQSPCILI